jgi:hypothetical protein
VVKQLPVEMLQQCSCMRTPIFKKEHNTGCQYSTLFVLNGRPYAFFFLVFPNTLLTSWFLVSWIPPSALLSYTRKQLPSGFWQADNVCLNFFNLFGVHHWPECYLLSTFRNETWISSPVTRTMWLRKSSLSLWYR